MSAKQEFLKVKSKDIIMKFLHDHDCLQQNHDHEHVTVDRTDWEEVQALLGFITTNDFGTSIRNNQKLSSIAQKLGIAIQTAQHKSKDIEYKIIQSCEIEQIVILVNQMISQGYICQGGICAIGPHTTSDGNPYYFQAMIKNIE